MTPGLWALLPFAAMLGGIALLPILAPDLWKRRYPWLSVLLGVPTVLGFLLLDRDGVWLHRFGHAAHEYASFLAILVALYVISGGVHLGGRLAGTPFVNAGILLLGALLASLIGTTGASMLLIRPLLAANRRRASRVHQVVFFLFLVSNAGGCLTPLGDPPLFLGYLRGVPFAWTFTLFAPWISMTMALLGLFFLWDYALFRRERGARADEAAGLGARLEVRGKANLLLLLGVVATVFLSGRFGWHVNGIQEVLLLGWAGLSWAWTPKAVREANAFSFHPVLEVAVLFAGIFATMVPALAILNALPERFPGLCPREPWQYFWATGLLSSVLDNAPTYLSFASVASGSLGTDAGDLSTLLAAPGGEALLRAISLGAVFFGAVTYIGNGPNFMVKAIAEEDGVRMPSFLGYLKWSFGILIPLFVVLTLAAM